MTQAVIDISPENSVIRLKNAVDDSLMNFSIFTPSCPVGESPTGGGKERTIFMASKLTVITFRNNSSGYRSLPCSSA